PPAPLKITRLALCAGSSSMVPAGLASRRPAGVWCGPDPTRRPSRELPQGRNAARVSGLWRVRGVPLFFRVLLDDGPSGVSIFACGGGAVVKRAGKDGHARTLLCTGTALCSILCA